MNFLVTVNLLIFAGVIFLLARLANLGLSLSQRVLAGLLAGILLGMLMQFAYGGAGVIPATLEWSNVVGSAYVSLLEMIVTPLILISIMAAVVRLNDVASLGRIGALVIGLLLGTTMIAALVSIIISNLFGLTAEGLTQGARELAGRATLLERQEALSEMSFPDLLVSFMPQNIFSDLAGLRATSIIAVVIFAVLAGIAGLQMAKDNPERGRVFQSFMETAQSWVLKLVRIVIGFTPYGVLALMLNVTASSSWRDILDLINFILASYLAIAVMFAVHGLLLTFSGVNAMGYFKKVLPVLAFAFTSRSSAATIPLNMETQVRELGNSPAVASFSASFGATVGQNGCAGIYPAMLAVMIAPTMGVNPMDPGFIVMLIAIVTISSLGVAGVGGGATFAALLVLPALGFPVGLAALLISIEPLIDMARTALNVNGAMTAGTITSRILHLTDEAVPLEDASGLSPNEIKTR